MIRWAFLPAIDVEQDGVEKPPGILRVETLSRGGKLEEIAEDQAASGVGGQLRAAKGLDAAWLYVAERPCKAGARNFEITFPANPA